jgi:hypothetical protein
MFLFRGLLDSYLEVFSQDGVVDITVLDRPLFPMDESVNLLPLFISGSPALKIELEPRVPAMKPGLYFTLPTDPLPVHIRKTSIFIKSLIRKGIIAQVRMSTRQVTEESTKPILVEYFLNNDCCAQWDQKGRHKVANTFLHCCLIITRRLKDIEIRLRCEAWGTEWEVPQDNPDH